MFQKVTQEWMDEKMAIKMSQLLKNNNVMHRKIVFFSVLWNGVGTFNLVPAVLVWNEKNREFCIFHDFSRVLGL